MTSSLAAAAVGAALAFTLLRHRLRRSPPQPAASCTLLERVGLRERAVAQLLTEPDALARLPFGEAAHLFSLSPHGFLPREQPLRALPAPFAAWEALVQELDALLAVRRVRSAIAALPLLPAAELKTEEEYRRALLLLCVFAHSYVWGEAPVLTALPPSISIPLLHVCQVLDMPPVLTHSSIVLSNYRFMDPALGFDVSNLATLVHFFGGPDETFFYMVTAEIEGKGGPALSNLWECQHLASGLPGRVEASLKLKCPLDEAALFDLNQMSGHLDSVTSAIEGMSVSMKSMRAGCDPYIFYHRVRPFLSGWKANPNLPDGLWFPTTTDGSAGVWKQEYGGSAAQSSLIAALDVALGVQHAHSASGSFLLAMREYMPHAHRQFLRVLEARPSIRTCVLALEHAAPHCTDPHTGDALSAVVGSFNRALSALAAFRAIHIAVVREFVVKQATATTQPEEHLSAAPTSRDAAGAVTVVGGAGAGAPAASAVSSASSPHVSRCDASAGTGVTPTARVASDTSGGKGTGGTDIIQFLVPLRQDTQAAVVGTH